MLYVMAWSESFASAMPTCAPSRLSDKIWTVRAAGEENTVASENFTPLSGIEGVQQLSFDPCSALQRCISGLESLSTACRRDDPAADSHGVVQTKARHSQATQLKRAV